MHGDEILRTFASPPGAYVHIPFCERICPFCPYNKVLHQPALVQRYFAALRQEIAQYTEQLEAPFTSLYIGGGTPTLCLDELASIVASIPVTGERAIEVLPTHATPGRLMKLEQMGINYVSLGAQSFDDRMLRYLKRPGTAEDNRRALDHLAGRFACVDVDLIFDVAFDDETIFFHDVETCFSAGVEQVSTYPLMRFGYTPFGKAHHDRHREHAVLRRAEAIAAQYGYERRSVWTFNRRDAPNYTSITRPSYLGLGAGSASYTGPLFLVNHFSIQRYIEEIEADHLPIARVLRLPPPVAHTYALFWQLYTGRVDSARLSERSGPVLRGTWSMLFHMLTAMGWLESKDQGIFALTPKGRDHYHDLERWVTYHFIEPLWAEMMQEHRTDASAPSSRVRGAGWLRLTDQPRHRHMLWRAASHVLE